MSLKAERRVPTEQFIITGEAMGMQVNGLVLNRDDARALYESLAVALAGGGYCLDPLWTVNLCGKCAKRMMKETP